MNYPEGTRWRLIKELDERDKWNARLGLFKCSCELGTEKVRSISHVQTGQTKSCGCLSREVSSRNIRMISTTHDMSDTTEYRIWWEMKRRCRDPNRPQADRYVGRGITVCDRWLEPKGQGFLNFYEDMGPRPSDKHSLDRYPDNDGIYEKPNCRWATSKEQNRNTSRNTYLNYDGRDITIAECAEITGLQPELISSRLRKGWSDERAVSSPSDKNKRKVYTIDGHEFTIKEICEKYGVSYSTIKYRIQMGKSFEEIINPNDTRWSKNR